MITPRTQRRLRAASLMTAGLVTAALAAGCANGLQTTQPGANPTVALPSTTGSPGADPTPTDAASTPSTETPLPSKSAGATVAPSGPGACTAADLTLGIQSSAGGGAAGSNFVLLTFRNRSNATCTLYGYPGVSFVGKGNGTQLGIPAVRSETATAETVRLKAGARTTALLRIVNAGVYDATQCAPTTADGFRVYPPGSKQSTFVAFETQACQKDPGDSKQLTVSPVGTSG